MSNIEKKYTLNFGDCTGLYEVRYNFAPGGNPLNAIPCRIVVDYDGRIYDSGFCGDTQYSNLLLQLGYQPVSSNSGEGVLNINKLNTNPSTGTLTVYSPLEGSAWEYNLTNCPICSTPAPTVAPTPTPGVTLTPDPTGPTPTPAPTSVATPTPAPTPTPTPAITPAITPTPTPTLNCVTCQQNPACCCPTPAPETITPTPTPNNNSIQNIDYPFIISNPIIKPNATTAPTETTNPRPSNCCPCGPRQGGDIHLGWSAYKTTLTGKYSENFIVVDDNYLYGEEIKPDVEKILFDHYAVEWIEKNGDSINAILSKRQQICKFPATTICGGIIVVGNPVAASIHVTSSDVQSPQCGQCQVTTKWYTYYIKIDPTLINSSIEYGGINWEYMKWLSNIENISPLGFTGPIGKRATFWNYKNFRTLSVDEEMILKSCIDSNNKSLLTKQSPYFVYNKVADLSKQVEEYYNNETVNIFAQMLYRDAIYQQLSYTGGSSDPCCTSSDEDLETGDCGVSTSGQAVGLFNLKSN